MTHRFAIYAAPGSGTTDAVARALREKAEQWLGRSVTGEPVTAAAPAGWTRAAVDAMTVEARRYGFHGTLKAPFRLAEGRTADELDAALASFAASRTGAAVTDLTLASLGSFFALVPGGDTTGLVALAADVVTSFDEFRAPLTGAERARRNPDALPARQRQLLETWGYPYVLDEFRFHLTLTDRVPRDRQPEVDAVLRDWFAGLLGQPVPVDALGLFTEATPGALFALRAVYPLRPAPARAHADASTVTEGTR